MAIVALVALLGAPGALADGDPASDVLLVRPLFQPLDVQIPPTVQSHLLGALAAAAHDGFPIRVALVGSAGDLGTVTSLWRRPGPYAEYLDYELSLDYSGQVLVVMPDGFGLWSPGHYTAGERSAFATLRPPGSTGALASAALQAVRSLAAGAGHPLAGAPVATLTPAGTAGSSDAPAEWIAFLIGLALVGLAWGASLRARPLAPRRRTT
jgi:hypothetical protein